MQKSHEIAILFQKNEPVVSETNQNNGIFPIPSTSENETIVNLQKKLEHARK